MTGSTLSGLHSHHLVLLSAQGDSGEMGFPGVAGLFGPKVQCTSYCVYSAHPSVDSLLGLYLALTVPARRWKRIHPSNSVPLAHESIKTLFSQSVNGKEQAKTIAEIKT